MSTKPFIHQLRVRYQETDQMGVVYHSNYLTWFEIGRTEWIREKGIPYAHFEQTGLLLPVTDIEAHYGQPAKYDNLVNIEVRLIECTNLRIGFAYTVTRAEDGVKLVTGKSRHVWVNTDWKPVRLDRILPEVYDQLKAQVEDVI